MAKGAIGKQNVIKKIQEVFGADFIGEIDKKIYVWTQENGERIQIAMSLTCPKTPVSVSNHIPTFGGGFDFEAADAAIAVSETTTSVEITDEERQTVADLMARLGL
jgi:hypothetical protein